jgi:hypothetical protein
MPGGREKSVHKRDVNGFCIGRAWNGEECGGFHRIVMTSNSATMMKRAQLIFSGADGVVGWVDIGAHRRALPTKPVNR